MKNYLSSAALIVVGLVVSSGTAFAQTADDTFGVSITITDECTITAAGDIGFASTGFIDTNVEATTTIDIDCTSGTDFNVGLNEGLNGGEAVGTTRAMANGDDSDFVSYELYQDAGYADVWGNVPGTSTNDGTTSAALTVYGQVPSGQNVSADSYSDTITATVWYGSAFVPEDLP